MARDWAGATTLDVCCCPTLAAFESDETPDEGFSGSPGIGEGAEGIEGEGTAKVS